ncbi:MAG: hypothetical protein HOE69_03360 [Euryarchaeota archaeon]|jgi:hypothetical protein|nr:hypothetical protein [Euryarchaeota archaeon]
MEGGVRRLASAVLLSLFFIASTILPATLNMGGVPHFFTQDDGQSENETDSNSSTNITPNWTAHAPVWSVGDLWTYSAVLDAQALIDDTPELDGAELDLLFGSANFVVMGVEELDVNGEITPVYRTVTSAAVVGDGRNLPAPIIGRVDGYLTASFVLTEYFRVGDLALVKYDKHIIMTFTAEISFVEQTVDLADFVESGVYSPPLEFYDFPLAMNESWNIVTNLTKTYSGNSDVVTIPSEPEYFDQEWSFIVNQTGDSGTPNCENSTKLWQLDSDGEVEEWRWWCPEVEGYSSRWTTDIALGGVNATLFLTGYYPASSILLSDVEISVNSTALNSEIDCWVNITAGSGEPIVGKSGYLYLRGVLRLSFTTDANGSALLRLGVGNLMDDTPTSQDWATHGVVAYLHSDQVVGATTLTLEGSAIGGLLRQDANRLAGEASAIMANQGAEFESSVRY